MATPSDGPEKTSEEVKNWAKGQLAQSVKESGITSETQKAFIQMLNGQIEATLDLPWVLGQTDDSKDDQNYIQWIIQASISNLQQELFQMPVRERPAALL